MKAVVTALGVVTVLVIAGLGAMHAGMFDVSTAWRDPALLRWVLVTTREASIKRRARDVQVPVLEGKARLERGFRGYRKMCVVCHGRPGGELSPLAKGLNPEAPDLSRPDHDMSAGELFWVIKNGIRMTGMPAWGRSHSEEELWDLVAFVKTLPTMSLEQYVALESRLPPSNDDRHDDLTPHHDEGAAEPHAH